MQTPSRLLACALLTTAIGSYSCSTVDPTMDSADFSAERLQRTPQGWDDAIRSKSRHISVGSQLMPLRWLAALEAANNTRRLTEQLAPFGFVSSDASPADNPDRLPLGFARDVDAETGVLFGDKTWVGLNCTACHTADLRIGGKTVRLEGAPSRIDFASFQYALLASVDATLADPRKLARFVRAVGETSDIPSETRSLRERLTAFKVSFRARIARSPDYTAEGKVVPAGPGRLDGMGVPTNETMCKLSEIGSPEFRALLENPANCTAVQPPSSIPYLWGVSSLEFVQWNGNVHSALGRNVGAVTGGYGTTWVEADAEGKPVLRTSTRFDASLEVGKWLNQLRSPSWRAMAGGGLVPALDDRRVATGRTIFEARCASCHAPQPEFSAPNAAGYSYRRIGVYGADEVGTDPSLAAVAYSRKATLPEIFVAPFKAAFGPDSVGPDNSVLALRYRAFAIGSMVRGEFKRQGTTPQRIAELTECRDGRQQAKVGYRARTLEGVVFTAPYLHNGSVPTIDDLLKPAVERPKMFRVGCRDYDVVRLGYACDQQEGTFVVDTALPSNNNRGHEYGTDLDSGARAALIEYLKSLEEPAKPPVPPTGICRF